MAKVNTSLMEIMYTDLRAEWQEEKKSMEDYITKLEQGVNDWAQKYQELEDKYQQDVPVQNDYVAGFHQAGMVNQPYAEEEDEFEDGKPQEEAPLEDEFKQTQNGYQAPIGYKRNNIR